MGLSGFSYRMFRSQYLVFRYITIKTAAVPLKNSGRRMLKNTIRSCLPIMLDVHDYDSLLLGANSYYTFRITVSLFNHLSCSPKDARERLDSSFCNCDGEKTPSRPPLPWKLCSRRLGVVTTSPPPKADPEQQNPIEREKKATLWQKAKKEILHYYHGFKLLGLEIKIASEICFRLLRGHALSRRERKQLVRTVADIIRLVPFAVFIIVPFMEFLLPVYLKFFPFMLPSTFKDKSSDSDRIRQRLKAKLELTRFLQETLNQTTGPTEKDDGSPTVSEFQSFLFKVQESGQPATNEDITRFSKLFEDQVTLDSLEVKQLKTLCQLLSLPTVGPSNLLRFRIWMRVRQLKAEDRLLAKEGVDEIPAWELQSLCQDRGMRSVGLTEARLRSQLSQWLALHLDKNIPVTLLLFSRALHVTQASADEILLKQAIAQLPSSASEEVTARVLETTSSSDLDPRAKIEVLRKEQAGIKAARAQLQQELAEQKSTGHSEAKLAKIKVDDVESQNSPIQAIVNESAKTHPISVDKRLLDSSVPKCSDRNRMVDEKSRTLFLESPMNESLWPHVNALDAAALSEHDSSADELTEISVDDLTQIESAISQSSSAFGDEALDGIKEKVAETTKERKKHAASLVASERIVDKRTSKAAARLSARVDRMIGDMDMMIEQLNGERQQLLKDIEFREIHVMHSQSTENTEMLDSIKADHQRVVDINDLLLSLRRIQNFPDDTRWQKILEVLDEDRDGKIELQHVLSVIELLSVENVKLTSKEVKRVLEMLDNEQLAKFMESGSVMSESLAPGEDSPRALCNTKPGESPLQSSHTAASQPSTPDDLRVHSNAAKSPKNGTPPP